MAIDLYRQTVLGDCLVEALEELMEGSKLNEDVAAAVCKQFDATMVEALRNHVAGKAVIKANLKTYRYFDGVWQFSLQDVSMRLSTTGTGSMANAPEVTCDKAKIICVDANLLAEPTPPAAPAAGPAADTA